MLVWTDMPFRCFSIERAARGLAVAGLLAVSSCTTDDASLESRSISLDPSVTSPTPAGSNKDISQLVRRAGPSYVTLNVSEVTGGSDTAGRGKDSFSKSVTAGSGFVVADGGYVLTAAHVAVKTGNNVSVRAANGKLYSGRVVSIKRDNDMALIKLKSFSGRAVTPAASACVARGESVFSLGKPEEGGDTARTGRVEAVRFGRAVTYGKFGYPDAMVLRMATKRGESGGPLFNSNGELAGMVVSTLADGNGQPLNLAHALPLSQIAPFVCASAPCNARWKSLASSGYCGS
jgi:S1-C subfamily serine protease